MNRASHKSLHLVSSVAPIVCAWLDFAVCEPRAWAGLTSVDQRPRGDRNRDGTIFVAYEYGVKDAACLMLKVVVVDGHAGVIPSAGRVQASRRDVDAPVPCVSFLESCNVRAS